MFFPIDIDGHLVNLAAVEKVGPVWRPLIASLVDEYQARYRDLVSVYVRGSVANGTAVFGRSDLDLIAVTRQDHPPDRGWMAGAVERTLGRHAITADIDLAITSATALLTSRKSAFYIKTQSALVYGEDFAPRIAPYRIDAEVFSHLPNLEIDLETVRRAVKDAPDDLARTLVLRLVKRVLRAGLELVAERRQVYTRDPQLCCDVFEHCYPEQAEAMREVLALMSGSAEPAVALKTMAEMVRWIGTERSRRYPRALPVMAFIDDLGV